MSTVEFDPDTHHVMAAQPDELVDLLVDPANEVCTRESRSFIPQDPDYTSTFLATYSYFVEPDVLLERVLAAFDKSRADLILSILTRWLTAHYHDFCNTPALETTLLKFINRAIAQMAEDRALCERLFSISKLCCQQQVARDLTQPSLKPSTTPGVATISPILDELVSFGGGSLDEWADLLRSLDSDLFARLTPIELMHRSASSTSTALFPNITALAEHGEKLAAFVVSTILTPTSAELRAVTIEILIELAQVLFDAGDFQSAFQIVATFETHGAIKESRLRQTWEKVGERHISLKQGLLARLQGSAYRREIDSRSEAVVPIVGMLIDQLYR